ncbi:MAG: biotin--[acetyl-CoA-carboxylase] ligase [Gammaproteobacteria bacterium]
MPQNLELLNKAQLAAYLKPENQSYLDKIVVLESVNSTNTFLVDASKNPDNKISICFAESQTAGKGRLGRQWISPFGCNIYLSLLWNFKCGLDQLSGLSIAVAMAVVEALKAYGIIDAIKLKWPNDVLWEGKKLAGILVELSSQEKNFHNAVIGVGLNVNMPETFSQDISQPWCDIAEIIGKTPDRNKLAGLLLDKLLSTLKLYQTEGFAPFYPKWKDLDAFYGQEVSISTAQEKIFGINRGIDAKGYLVLEASSGPRIIATGETAIANT